MLKINIDLVYILYMGRVTKEPLALHFTLQNGSDLHVNKRQKISRAAKNSDFVRVVGFCAVLAGTRTDILPTSVAFGFR